MATMMEASRLIRSLDWFGGVLPGVVAGVADDDARWKPADGAWSILEIIGHLLDEEVRDFRTRVRLTLEDPMQDWPKIDPEGWAVAERYNDRDLDDVAQKWIAERRTSVLWLRGMTNVDWSRSHPHPKAGQLSAGDLLTAWAAHDALHLRQIAKRLFQLAERNGGECSARYAGEWRA
jgi:hypothetical protein